MWNFLIFVIILGLLVSIGQIVIRFIFTAILMTILAIVELFKTLFSIGKKGE